MTASPRFFGHEAKGAQEGGRVMSMAALIRRMADAGATPESIAIAVEAIEAFGAREDARRYRMALDEQVWVYVIGVDHPDTDLIKVGISKHPNYRRITLEKERGLNLYVAHTEGPYTRPQATSIEKIAHQMLSSHREQGEWFLCGVDHAVDAVRTCAIGDGL